MIGPEMEWMFRAVEKLNAEGSRVANCEGGTMGIEHGPDFAFRQARIAFAGDAAPADLSVAARNAGFSVGPSPRGFEIRPPEERSLALKFGWNSRLRLMLRDWLDGMLMPEGDPYRVTPEMLPRFTPRTEELPKVPDLPDSVLEEMAASIAPDIHRGTH